MLSDAVLDAMDVGPSDRLKASVVPHYDDRDETCICYVKRTEMPKCSQCEKFHCEFEDCGMGNDKWSLPAGFPRGEYLYNYAAARKSEATVWS
jgi:hypothetical protein